MATDPFDAVPAHVATNLQDRYTVTSFRVISSNSISNRTAAVGEALQKSSERCESSNTKEAASASSKLPLVTLSALSKNANKLISIVEIVKRERQTRGELMFQYNALTQQLMDVPREKRKPKVLLDAAKATKNGSGDGNDDAGGSNPEDDEDEDVFETIADPQDGLPATKKRNVPIMTVFLSTVSVKELKAAFG